MGIGNGRSILIIDLPQVELLRIALIIPNNQKNIMTSFKWSENWMGVSDVTSGSQARSKIVRHLSETDDTLYFLKILQRQDDPERRKRMHREVESYRTLSNPGIPKVIESNAHYFDDLRFKPYVVTELIEGVNLSEFVAENGPLQISEAIELTESVLGIVSYCHAEECVHRDIKPDNIMLRNGDVSDPVLVDFGLSFNASEPGELETEEGQELGNRFLKLPELMINSPNKRDLRSDLTAVCGILYYVLTGIQPTTLLDEKMRLPHQREEAMKRLSVLPANLPVLNQLFDRGFQNDIDARWQNGDQLAEFLKRAKTATMAGKPKSSQEILDELTASAMSASMTAALRIREQIESGLRSVENEFRFVMGRLKTFVFDMQSGYEVDIASFEGKNSLGAKRRDGQGEAWFAFRVTAVGSQLIISCQTAGKTMELLRTDANNPGFDEAYKESVRHLVSAGVSDLLK